MAKTETNKEAGDCGGKLDFQSGLRFGLGFVLANILGWAIVVLVVWLILLLSRASGSIL